MTQELKPGEFYVNDDGSITYCTKTGGSTFTNSADVLKRNGWRDAEHWAQHLVGFCYTRVSTEGSAIKEVAPAEVKRAPLPNSDAWRYTDKRVDRWAGFVVDKMDINMPCDPWKNNRHALQRMSEGINPTHGSALLLKD